MSPLHTSNLSVFTFMHMHVPQPLGLTQENPLVAKEIRFSKNGQSQTVRPVKPICFLSLQKGYGNDGKETLFYSSVSCDQGGLVDGLTDLGVADTFDAGQFPAQALKFSQNSYHLMEESERIQLEKK